MKLSATPVLAVAAAAVLLLLSGCASPRTVHQQKDFRLAGSRIVIDAAGSADLRLVPGGTRRIRAQRWLSGTAARPGHASWTMSGDTLRLSVDCTGLVFHCGARFQVAVPPGIAVVVHSSAGGDTVSGLADSVVIDGGSGTVRLRGTAGQLRVSTGAGDVTGSAIRSPVVRVTSGQGDADLGFATAPRLAELRCGAGSATVRVPVSGHQYRVSVTSGTGTARRRVPDDPGSRSLVQVTSGQGDAAVLPVS